MRVLITSGIFPPEIGGPATYAESFARWMSFRGHRVTVVAALVSEPSADHPFRLLRVRKSKHPLFWHIRAFFAVFAAAGKCDILYANGLFLESSIAATLRRRKIVFRIPGDEVWERARRRGWSDRDFLDFQHEKGNLGVGMLRAIRRFYLNRASRVIAPSFFLGETIARWGIAKDRIDVIHNPFSPAEPQPFPLPECLGGKFMLATGGRLVSWKGIDSVLRAVNDLDDVSLSVFGDGPEREHLVSLSRRLRIDDRVAFVGSLAAGHLRFLFAQAGLFVLFSSYEGLPHAVLEAMAAGCPVIASDAGGIPEIIEDGKEGILVPVGNGKALLAAIKKLKNDPNLRLHLMVNAKTKIEEKFNQDLRFAEVAALMGEAN